MDSIFDPARPASEYVDHLLILMVELMQRLFNSIQMLR